MMGPPPPVGSGGYPIAYSAIQFDLEEIPLGSTILEAELKITCETVFFGGQFGLYRITKDWDKDKLSWDDINENWVDLSTGEEFFVNFEDAGRTFKFDVKEMVQDMIDNEAYYGFALVAFEMAMEVEVYFSAEEGDDSPELYVRYE
jgi:hypothetical protein